MPTEAVLLCSIYTETNRSYQIIRSDILYQIATGSRQTLPCCQSGQTDFILLSQVPDRLYQIATVNGLYQAVKKCLQTL